MTPSGRLFAIGFIATLLVVSWVVVKQRSSSGSNVPVGREEVVYWHFWGGEDRDVVDDVVARFNQSQDEYFVRAVAMPGNNLHAKLFLSVAGGDPPDLVNQDDPVIPDWAARGVIQSLDQVADANEVQAVEQ